MLVARKMPLLFQALVVALAFVHGAQGHGHLVSPRSRNYVANQDGREGTPTSGSPPPEYCPHCLNGNRGVCGLSPSYDYDLWLDSTGAAMPWVSQASYASGSVIRVMSHLTAHHGGHMELKACPNGRQSTQACFDQSVLTFVRDVLHGMPADPAHPERGYYSGGAYSGVSDFEMEFKLPANLVGANVLLQVRC
jgi:Lytic polysaccharide mono-oxygenase, cellulose-degrading